jgi:type I restriction enzyme S subunit
MRDWSAGILSDAIESLDAGVSVNAEDRPHGAGEIGVLKTSAASGGKFIPEQNKTILPHERRLVSEPVQGDSIIVSRMNTPALVGESCYVKEPHPSLFLPDRLWQLKPKDRTKLSMRWLSFILQSRDYRRYIEVHATGTSGSMKNLPKSKLMALPVHFPEYPEQALIAQILDTLDTAIQETEALIAKLKAVKQGLLHDLLTRGIDANGELRPPQAEAPQLYKESALGWIPKEWDFSPLVSKIDFPAGQVDPRLAPYRDWVLVAPDHIESGTGRLLTTATADEQQAISGKYVFEAGDVIYSKIRPYLRKATLASNSGLCSADMYPLRPKAGIESRYLLAVVLGDQFSRFSESVSMRSGFPKINRSEMAEFSIGWPCPEEQVRIAQLLCESDSTQRIEEHQRDKLELLKSGLMDDLLTGHVRVTPLLNSADPLVQPPAALIRQQTVGQMGGCDA